MNTKMERKPLTSEEISAIVENFDPIDYEEMEMMAKLPLGERWLVIVRKSGDRKSVV